MVRRNLTPAQQRLRRYAQAGMFAIVVQCAGAREVFAEPECAHWRQTATTQVLMNVCSNLDAQRSTRTVSKRYLDARQAASGPSRRALDASQKAWAKYRDTYCAERAASAAGGSMQPLVISDCLDLLDGRRALDLANDQKH